MNVIFISGKYRDDSEWGIIENIRHAEEAAIMLWKRGWAVICPHKNTAHFGGLCPDSFWLEGDLEILKRCDAIFMLKGWEQSEGAKEEYNLALKLGLGIYTDNSLPKKVGESARHKKHT